MTDPAWGTKHPAFSQSAQFSEESPDPLLEVHVTGVVTYMNAVATSTFPDLPSLGFRHTVLEGLPEMLGALRDESLPAIQREIRAGGRVYDQKVTMAKGSEFLRIYLHDVTHRIQTEAELTMANMSLLKLVEDLKQSQRRLDATQSQLIQAEKLSAIGQLASGIAHEVKNPLGVCMQGIDYLEQELATARGQVAEVLRLMKDAVLRADKIVHGLLDFSRPAPLELKVVSIAPVLESALALVEQQLAAGNVRIVKEIRPDLEPVLIDENRMKQAFINLMLNAFQAMPTGGQLTIRASSKKLTEAGGRVGQRHTDVFRVGQTVLVCDIEDTGRGVPAALLAKVFDPFVTTNPPGKGTGLGLTITQAIIEQHRGLIEMESHEGRGTTVTVTLPLSKRLDAPEQ